MSTATSVRVTVEGRKTDPIYIWATIGGFFFLLSIYVFGSWILSDDFKTVDPGTDVMPWYTAFLVPAFQILNVMAAAVLITWGLRTCRREGRITTAMLFIIGWWFTLWQDPLADYCRQYLTYNAHLINFGSWVNSIPGWVMPNGHNFAEPIIFNIGAYASVIPFLCFFCAWLMRKAKARWPEMGTLGLIGVACIAMMIADLIIEGGWVRTGLYAFTGAVHSWSIWGGNWYHFPIYQSIAWGPVLAVGGVLYYFKDDKGNTVVERGCENISSLTTQTFLRLMAITAVFNIAYLCYNLVMIIIAFQMDQTPEMPSYMSHGLCGPGTEYACPGPDHHMPLIGSGALQPVDCSLVERAGGRILSDTCL